MPKSVEVKREPYNTANGKVFQSYYVEVNAFGSPVHLTLKTDDPMGYNLLDAMFSSPNVKPVLVCEDNTFTNKTTNEVVHSNRYIVRGTDTKTGETLDIVVKPASDGKTAKDQLARLFAENPS